MNIGAQWVGLFAIAVASVCTTVQAQPSRDGTEPEQKYMSPNGWTISYPGDWTIDSTKPNDVSMRAPENSGMCTVFSGLPLRFKSADELTDRLLANDEQHFRREGLQFAVVGRRRISLPSGVTATEVLVELGRGSGGKSRRVYGVVGDGQGWVIDCETYARNWEKLEGVFDRIINSFSLKPDTAAQQVYRWVDKDGEVHYTQTPPPETHAQPPKTKAP